MDNIKVGDRVKLRNLSDWEGWGFEDSVVKRITKFLSLILIESSKGHTMWVKLNEIVHL